MKKISFHAVLILLFICNSFAQTGGLIVAPGARLPEDSVVRGELMSSLRGWLTARNGPDSINGYVAEADRPAMAVLMGQLRALKGGCYLGGLTALDSDHWQIQLNYMAMRKGTPVVQACCTVMARREGGRVFISSPLAQNASHWRSRTIGCCTFHYPGEINVRQAAVFERTVVSYDRRLKIGEPAIDFYCCTNLMEAAKLIGIDYMSSY